MPQNDIIVIVDDTTGHVGMISLECRGMVDWVMGVRMLMVQECRSLWTG